MPAYMKLGTIEGEATDKDHDKWIIIQSLSSPIFRSIPEGAKDQQRTKGSTTLGDIVVVRESDKSSTKLAEACATGQFYETVEIHFCTTSDKKQEPYYKLMLNDVIVTSYSWHGNAEGSPLPTEEVTLNYTAVEWTYVIVDPKTGKAGGNIPAKYNPGTSES